MTDADDMTLLQKWAEARSEAAFRTLVERYAPLVWGAALRRTGDHGMSEEASQQVFADLARKAPVLVELHRPLAAWLHRSAVYEAVQVLRREIRHRDRMKHYAALETAAPEAPDPWEDVRPHLDEAINALAEPDRRVLLLHGYQR
jgi:DNA-directed RNA polymerase specialized sigma24 family protein